MKILERFKIRTKILLTVALPMVLLLVIGILIIQAKLQTTQSMETVSIQASLITKASALVHEMQKERGLTAGYIGSNGKKFAVELQAQQKETDQRNELLKEFYQDNREAIHKKIRRSIEDANKAVENRKNIRGAVLTGNIASGDAISYYTETHAKLLGAIPVVLELITDNHLSKVFGAYYQLLMGKERAGIERAVLAGVFSKNSFSDAGYNKFLGLLVAQNTYFSSFNDFAEEEYVEAYVDILKNSAVQEVERFRTIAVSSSNAKKIGVDAGEWFKNATQRINLLKDLENRMNEGILAYAEQEKDEAGSALVGIIILFSVVTILSIVFVLFVVNKIVHSLKTTIAMLQDIAEGEGDLTKRLQINGKDEIGVMSTWFNTFINNIQEIMIKVNSNVEVLSSSSEELSAVSSQLLEGAEKMVNQTTGVADSTELMNTNITTMASAAEEMSVNANEVAGAAEQTSQNMNAVSSAVEEMSVSISQIAQDADSARVVAEKATTSSQHATTSMGTLSEAAREIGNVTEVIKRIAEQTNLLALNATIEAASAGDAGKGFAVVANEIKELANQSAQAADDIAGRIEGVQSNTNEAVMVINGVAEVTEQIGKTVNSIAQSVEQQSQAVNDISANVVQAGSGTQNIAGAIAEVAKGANDVSRNSGEASSGTSQVTENINGIRSAVEDANSGAGQVNASSRELAKMSSELKEIVGQFKL
ncbi:MAG: nitrate- and nitrite sensing domain-containing protein [Fibrobacterales bacterium]